MSTDIMKKGQLVRVNGQVYGTSKQNRVVDLVDGDNESFYAHELDVVNMENK